MSTNAASAGPSVTFWGAAQTVTGSMHLVQVAGRRLLLDCGLFQGRRDESRHRNATFPFKPAQLDAVVLSHAHIDHCGNLPNLVRQGFPGPIYCTPATRDLVAIMLADSAKIQEEDAAFLNRKHYRRGPPIQPLYTRKDVFRTVRLVHAIPYDKPFEPVRGIEAGLVDAGHLLGSAMVSLRIAVNGSESRLTFTGDLGRRGLPILRDPVPVPPAELLISESTYGGQVHAPVEQMGESLGEVVRRTVERGGKVLIPAFSLGRTQTVVYFLHRLMATGRLHALPIFVDSPLAARATEVFRLHPECFDEDTAILLADNPDLFGEKRITYIQNVEDSIRLNSRQEPCIIIAASGMCEAGRILHHLKHNVENDNNTILIIGYQAPDTLGRRLVERQQEVRILDRFFKLRANVVVMNGLSSHADHNDFLAFLGPLAGQTRKVRLVHGEPPRSEALAAALRATGFADVGIPARGEVVQINN